LPRTGGMTSHDLEMSPVIGGTSLCENKNIPCGCVPSADELVGASGVNVVFEIQIDM